MSIQQLKDRVLAYTAALKQYIDVRTNAALVSEEATIPAESSVDYDLTTLLGENHANYDKRSASVTVLVEETEVGSPLEGYFINSEGVLTVGIDINGNVRLHNYQTTSVTCHVRIDVPREL